MMAQVDAAQVAQMEAERASTQAQINEAEAERKKIQEKIDRLQIAKRKVAQEKENLEEIDASQLKFFKQLRRGDTNSSPDWRGMCFDKVKEVVNDSVCDGFSEYYSGVDEILDEICNEITRLQNQIYQQDQHIGWLYSLLNSLGNAISNFFN